jgi:hypothetical protein
MGLKKPAGEPAEETPSTLGGMIAAEAGSARRCQPPAFAAGRMRSIEGMEGHSGMSEQVAGRTEPVRKFWGREWQPRS